MPVCRLIVRSATPKSSPDKVLLRTDNPGQGTGFGKSNIFQSRSDNPQGRDSWRLIMRRGLLNHSTDSIVANAGRAGCRSLKRLEVGAVVMDGKVQERDRT